MKVLQDYQEEFAKRNAVLIAVSPITPDNSLSMQEKHNLTFDVLSDPHNRVARQYGLVFTLDATLVPIYKQFGIDLEQSNGEDSWELPLTPTYVIAPDRTIRFAHIDVDYRNRMEPEEILAALDSL